MSSANKRSGKSADGSRPSSSSAAATSSASSPSGAPVTTNEAGIVRFTAAELRAKLARGDSRTDWARIDAMTEAELEASIAADPDWADVPHDWARHAIPVFVGPGAKTVSLTLPADVAAWLLAKGGAIQSEVIIALRTAMRAEQDSGPPNS